MERHAATGRHYMVGGGIAALAAAVLLVRDGGVPGDRITILEHRGTAGGSLDGAGDAELGYLTRGGRMFEPNFVCTLDLLATIPAPDDPAMSVRDDILAFNRMVAGLGECRLVRDGRKPRIGLSLGLEPEDIVALNRLLLTPEGRLEGRASTTGSRLPSSTPISGSCGPPCSRSSRGIRWPRCGATCGASFTSSPGLRGSTASCGRATTSTTRSSRRSSPGCPSVG